MCLVVRRFIIILPPTYKMGVVIAVNGKKEETTMIIIIILSYPGRRYIHIKCWLICVLYEICFELQLFVLVSGVCADFLISIFIILTS